MLRTLRGIASSPLPFALVSGLLLAQDPPKPAPQPEPAKPAAQTSGNSPNVRTVLEKRNWVRWVSVGVTLSVLGQYPIGDGETVQESTNFVLTGKTESKGNRMGWGGVVQVRLPAKFAVAGSLLLHRSKLESSRDSFEGLDNPNTPLDDRKHTTIEEDSTIKYQTFALLLRRYSKDHTESGHRWFYEGGLSLRRANKIETSRQTTVGADNTTDTAPIVPNRKTAKGFTGGIGAQFVDDFGIRLVPEFRYTRWAQPMFNQFSTESRKNQYEAIVSITF